MLSKKAATAIANVGKVNQRAFTVGGVKRTELAPISANVRESLKVNTPENIPQDLKDECYPKLGNRDIVGPSFSITFDYHDMPSYPAPSVRWAPNTPEVLALRQKELGDWNTLTLEEKKQLYRNSFCQTFAEFTAPTGEWKRIGYLLFYTLFASLAMLVYNLNAYGTWPKTFNVEFQQEMVAGMLMKNVGPFRGISSKYDFEKNEWKK